MFESKGDHNTPLLVEGNTTKYQNRPAVGMYDAMADRSCGAGGAGPGKIPVLQEHKKSCDDYCRCNVCGHAYHWSEGVVFLVLVAVSVNKALNPFKHLGVLFEFYLLLGVSAFGLVILWNTGYLASEAEYSRKISEACQDMNQESEVMEVELETLEKELLEERRLAALASKQTAEFAKEVGILSEEGKVVKSAFDHFNEAFLQADTLKNIEDRNIRVQKIESIVTHEMERGNAYDRFVVEFQSICKSRDGGGIDYLKEHSAAHRFTKIASHYNKAADSNEFLFPISTNIIDYAGEASAEGHVSMLDFAESSMQMIFGVSASDIMKRLHSMGDDNNALKKRLNAVNESIYKANMGRWSQRDLDDLMDSEVRIADAANVVFSTSQSSFNPLQEMGHNVLKLGTLKKKS